MRIVRASNRTRGGDVVLRVEVASDPWSRFWGLMGRRELAAGHGLLIKPCSSIHMFFMRFPIDVIFLDGDNVVVKVVHGIKPWRMAMGGGGKNALELPAGTAATTGVSNGDQLEFTEAA